MVQSGLAPWGRRPCIFGSPEQGAHCLLFKNLFDLPDLLLNLAGKVLRLTFGF